MKQRRWSPIVGGLEWVGGLALPTASVWRRNMGFANHPASMGMPVFPDARSVLDWLVAQDEDLSLVLVFRLGGRQRSQAWLGLTARAATAEGAARRLRSVAPALSEALDMWRLFLDTPESGPRVPQQTRGLQLLGPGEASSDPHYEDLRLLDELHDLGQRDRPVTLRVELRPQGQSPDIVAQAEGALMRVMRRVRSREDAMSALRIRDLVDRVTGCDLRVSLHGEPPGPISRMSLARAMSLDLGIPVGFDSGRGERVPVPGSVARRLLMALGTGDAIPRANDPMDSTSDLDWVGT